MTASVTPEARPARRSSRAVRRAGYLFAAALNAVMLWIAHQLLDWGWPRFLTDDFEELLPWVTASLVLSIVCNLVYVVTDTRRVKASGDLVTAVIGFVVAVRTWQVFPFDFSSYATDWSWVLRTVLVIAMVGTVLGAIAALVRLVTPHRSGQSVSASTTAGPCVTSSAR